MAIARSHASDIRVDQIPVGVDYGLEFEPEEHEPASVGPIAWPYPRRRWLTRWNGFDDYERVQLLPPDAVVSFKYDGVRYFHYGIKRAA